MKLFVNKSIRGLGVVVIGLIYFPALTIAQTSDFRPILASFIVTPTEARPGDSIQCKFVFGNQGTRGSQSDEAIFLHFVDTENPDRILWQNDHPSPIPTLFWSPEATIQDGPIYTRIPSDTTVSRCGVRVGLWNRNTGQRSLDVLLPATITISASAEIQSSTWVPSLSSDEIRRRYLSLSMRFLTGPSIRLDSDHCSLMIQPDKGNFSIKHKETGSIWQSPPQAEGLGILYAEYNGSHHRIAIDQLTILNANKDKCVLAKTINGMNVIEMTFHLDARNRDPIIRVQWKNHPDWTFHRIDFNHLLWTSEGLGGGAVIPRLQGQFFKSNNPYEIVQLYTTYDGWNGLNIPMSGMVRDRDSAYLCWDSPYVSSMLRSEAVDHAFFPGKKIVSLGLRCPPEATGFEIHLIKGNSYSTMAQSYREVADANKLLVTMNSKIRKNAEVKKLIGAAEFKPFVLIRWNGEEEKTRNDYTEDDCMALARHLYHNLQLEKVLFVLAGWIRRGYDNQHPDILPAAPEIGGDDGVRQISELVRSFGYLFGLHDNYQDIYRDSPSWNEDAIMVNKDGSLRKGGVWAGGQSWLLASSAGLEFAKRNLPEVRKRHQPNAYFIDTTYAAPLYESHHPTNPMTRLDDLKNKNELSAYAARLFGVHGSETGMAFGVPYSHYFEGIVSGHSFLGNYPDPGSIEIPFFSLVFHDCVAMYTHQGDRSGLADARKILKHLVTGTMPLYKIPPHRYWETEIPEPDLSDPNNCFVKAENGWGEGKHPIDRFIKNTYSFLSPFSTAVAHLPMTEHQYLKDDLSVEYSRFGDHWYVVVNYGPADYQIGETILPPMGFIAMGPNFLAQHFYSIYEARHTALIVHHGDEIFYGFR